MILSVDGLDDLAGFMEYINGNLAREAARLVDWKEKFWSRRYQCILISDEERIQISRFRYMLSHGPKEDLLLSPREWPGLHCVDALTEGKPLEGVWYDRSLEYEANRRGKEVDPEAFITRYELNLAPCPAGST